MMFSLGFVGGGGGGGGSKSVSGFGPGESISASGFGPGEPISTSGFGPGGPNRWDTGVGKRIVMFQGFFANLRGKFISHRN